MTQESQVVQDAEDEMAAALAEIRNERAEGTPVVETAIAPAQASEVQAVEEQPAAQEPAQEAAPATPDLDPAEQLKAIQTELHKAQSELGRVSALNRKYLEAAREAAALREQLAQVQQQAQPAATPSEALTKLEAVAEQVKDFPELAGIVAAVSDAIKQTDKKAEEVARRAAAQVVEPLEPLRREQTSRLEQEQQAAYDAAMATFNSTYPTAVEVVKSGEFKTWLARQPSQVQHAFAQGQTPMEALTVMDAYDMHLRRSGLPSIAQINVSQPSGQPTGAVKTAPNVNRLQRAAGIPSRSAGSQGGQPPEDDFDASLAYFRNKRLAAARAAA